MAELRREENREELSVIRRFDRGLCVANQAVLAALLAIMALLVFGNVVLRYVFGISLSWVEELTRYMMIWLAWLGAGLALREGAHIAIDTLQQALPDAGTRIVRVAVLAAMIGFFGALVWLGWRYSIFAWRQQTAVLRLPAGLVYLAIPIGSGLMLLHLLLTMRSAITHTATAEEQARAAEMSAL
jgi:TRAP-type C4-dicarboxylate transport system permease small subunit